MTDSPPDSWTYGHVTLMDGSSDFLVWPAGMTSMEALVREEVIASVFAEGDTYSTSPVGAARAAMMAAAPEMAAAIRGAISWAERTGIADSDPPEYLALVAALVRAEGRADG